MVIAVHVNIVRTFDVFSRGNCKDGVRLMALIQWVKVVGRKRGLA